MKDSEAIPLSLFPASKQCIKKDDTHISLDKEPIIPILQKLNHYYLGEPFIEPRSIVGRLSISISTRQPSKHNQYKHRNKHHIHRHVRSSAHVV